MTTDQNRGIRVLFNLKQQMAKLVRQRERLELQERLIAEKKKAINEEMVHLDDEIADAAS